MTSYSEDVLVQKLSKLVDTQDSITVLSQWLMYHRKHAAASVQTWARQLHKAPPHRKLPFLHLANDVVQNSRRKGEEFTREFAKVFPTSLPHVYRHTATETQPKILRLLDIWESRKIYAGEFISGIRKNLANHPQSKPATGTTHVAIPEVEQISTHLAHLAKHESQKHKLAHPLSSEITTSIEQLEQYQTLLQSDIAERRKLILVLGKLIEKQELFIKGEEISLGQCREKIEMINGGGRRDDMSSMSVEAEKTPDNAEASPEQEDKTFGGGQGQPATIPTTSTTELLEQLRGITNPPQQQPAEEEDDDVEYDPEMADLDIPMQREGASMNPNGNDQNLITNDILKTLEFLTRQAAVSQVQNQ